MAVKATCLFVFVTETERTSWYLESGKVRCRWRMELTSPTPPSSTQGEHALSALLSGELKTQICSQACIPLVPCLKKKYPVSGSAHCRLLVMVEGSLAANAYCQFWFSSSIEPVVAKVQMIGVAILICCCFCYRQFWASPIVITFPNWPASFLQSRCLSTNHSGLKRREDLHPSSSLGTCLHVDFHLRTTLPR